MCLWLLFSAAWAGTVQSRKDFYSFRPFPLTHSIKIFVASHPDENALYRKRYGDYVKQCMREWSNATEGRLRYQFVSKSKGADIVIRWVKAPSKSSYAGFTRFRFRPMQASIDVFTEKRPDVSVRTAILHELGHSLGIMQHSPNPDDVMYPTQIIYLITPTRALMNSPLHLSARDKQAIQKLYSTKYRLGSPLYEGSIATQSPKRIYIFEHMIETLKGQKSLVFIGAALMFAFGCIPPSVFLTSLMFIGSFTTLIWGGWLIWSGMFLTGALLMMIGLHLLPLASMRHSSGGWAFYLYRAERLILLFALFCLFLVVQSLERDPNIMITFQ